MSACDLSPPTLVTFFATVFVLGILPRAQADEHRECSNASLQGSFGFTSTGTLLALPSPLAGPFAEVGRQTFDGNGNTDATATASPNGNIVKLTLQGTYVVNPDCTGSMTLYVFELGRSSFHEVARNSMSVESSRAEAAVAGAPAPPRRVMGRASEADVRRLPLL
jgi:hypothetical protein